MISVKLAPVAPVEHFQHIGPDLEAQICARVPHLLDGQVELLEPDRAIRRDRIVESSQVAAVVLSRYRPAGSVCRGQQAIGTGDWRRSEEHTSELQSLMRISYAGFCLKNKNPHLSHT